MSIFVKLVSFNLLIDIKNIRPNLWPSRWYSEGRTMIEIAAVPISESLIRQYDVSGPRYTSYPTADRFVEAFTAQDYIQALEQRRSGASALALPLSLYVHIPFCESLCYYCACNKIITKHHDRAAAYINYLSREVDLHTDRKSV